MVGAKIGVAACIKETEFIGHIAIHGHALKLFDNDTLKVIKIIREHLGAGYELTKVIKCSMFLK